MAFGVATNCVKCKVLSSQILTNEKDERICSNCLQIEYNNSCANLKRAFDELYIATKKNDEMKLEIQVFTAVLQQIKGLVSMTVER